MQLTINQLSSGNSESSISAETSRRKRRLGIKCLIIVKRTAETEFTKRLASDVLACA